MQSAESPEVRALDGRALRTYDWVESRHDLDMLKGKSRVQFRIAYGSDGTALFTNGIAFDNFRIAERDRTVLLEHFTNSADSASKAADMSLNSTTSADSLDVVDLQYHTSFPGADPFNEQEPYVPSSRLLYYGLMDVPYTILNGGTDIDHRFDYKTRTLKLKPIRVESLENARFGISIYSELINNNTLYITSQVTALDDLPASEYTIHMGIVERKITGETGTNGETEFRNVVKAFLPDPAGTTLFRAWNKNDVDTVKNYWYLQNVYNQNELMVFTFIQDEATSEIYQAAMNKIDFVTGARDVSSSDNQLLVYPNPANKEFFVQLGKPVIGNVTLNIYNDVGTMVRSVVIPGSAEKSSIPASGLPDGIYIIRVVSGTSLLGIQKLNISH